MYRNSDISTTPPDHANSNPDAWRVARAIEARHGYLPDTFDDLITGTNVTDKEKVHWYGRKGKGGHLENMKKQVVNERIGSGTWFSEFVEGEFSADMAQLAVTNFELMARWYKQVDEENGQHGETDEKKQGRLGVAQLFRDAITRTQEHSQRAYDKAHLYAQTEFASFPDNSNAASKTMLRRRIAEYARLMTEQLTPAFGPQHAFSNRREIEAAILLPHALRAHNVRMTFWKQRLTRSMLARWLRELRGVVDLKYVFWHMTTY
ncbi:hypothetical protein SLS60_004272 [Paraconiothyrium brasiliense]|uniref:Uncharacterized protein n=1 Tax=Paraconiothyrium brasiliense TaxID=300254 RepID=A0ABR3RQZ6_9PLEO